MDDDKFKCDKCGLKFKYQFKPHNQKWMIAFSSNFCPRCGNRLKKKQCPVSSDG